MVSQRDTHIAWVMVHQSIVKALVKVGCEVMRIPMQDELDEDYAIAAAEMMLMAKANPHHEGARLALLADNHYARIKAHAKAANEGENTR